MGTNYWRKINDFPYSRVMYAPGVFVSGTVNWYASNGMSSFSCAIVSLDLETESYQKLSWPDYGKDYRILTLRVFGDCLCIVTYNYMFLDVWIMKEYGNIESLTKLYSVPFLRNRNWGIYPYPTAIYISEDDQVLFDYHELTSSKLTLAVYDSKNGTVKIPEIQNTNGWMDPEVYVESLISPCS